MPGTTDRIFSAALLAAALLVATSCAAIQSTIQSMTTILKENRKSINIDQYMYSLKFLESLSVEAKIPVGS